MIDLPEAGPSGLTWRTLVLHAEGLLAAAGMDSALVDARRIVEEAAGMEPSELTLAMGESARTAGVASFQRMVSRRLEGEPLQYVLGSWGFRTLDLMVDRQVLIPRPETEVVAGVAIDAVRAELRPDRDPPVAVDLGTGSGAIGLSIAAEVPGADVWLTDASPEAVAVARANVAGLGRRGAQVRIVQGSWFDGLPPELRGRIDVVVSNPPYIADGEELPAVVDEWEPASALRAGPTGLECYEMIAADAPGWLARPGHLVVEIAPHQQEPVAAMLRNAGAEVRSGTDLSGRERWVAGTWDATSG